MVKLKVAQSCLTLCDPIDCTVCGILQARILEWVAFPFSEDLPNPGIKPRSLSLQVDCKTSFDSLTYQNYCRQNYNFEIFEKLKV